VPEPALPEKSIFEQHPYLTKGFAHFENLAPIPAPAPTEPVSVNQSDEELDELVDEHEPLHIKEAIKKWKAANPDDTIKNQRHLLQRGTISELPWIKLVEPLPDYQAVHGFGAQLPDTANKGDTYIRTDSVPNRLFKYNGTSWIEVDKNKSDSYTYNSAYIEYLVQKIISGEYDPELLTDGERTQIETKLRSEN
jgi:hypothetical protein